MRVGITGASGLIGSALAERLRAEGHSPVAFVRHAAAGDEIAWDPGHGLVDPARLDELDAILHALIEEEKSSLEIVQRGYDPAVVEKVWRMLDTAEYKRRQAPPGVKITRRAFGKDRRYPITNAFRGRKLTKTP